LTLGLAVSGSLLNGYQLAVVVQEMGWWSLLMGSPHFLPETAAFVCFTAIGLWPALRVFRHLIEWLPRESMVRGSVRALVLAAAGTCLLLVAAWLESGTA